MQGDELLSITPEALAEAILKRRQRMTEHLPKTLQQRTEENNRAHQLASEARATLSALEADDSNATQEEVDRARVTYCLLYTSPSPRDAESSRMPSSA